MTVVAPHLGHAAFDAEHDDLAELVGAVLATAADDRARTAELFARLRSLAVEHLLHEEEAMRRTGFPEEDAHRQEHLRLTEVLDAVAARHRAGWSAIDTVSGVMQAWVTEHIATYDRRLVAWLRHSDAAAAGTAPEGGAAPPEDARPTGRSERSSPPRTT